MEYVGIDERTGFVGRSGETVTINPGLYRVDVAGDGQLALIADDGTATLVEAERGGHPLELDAPLAVAFEVEEGDRRVAVLLPGGVAMVAGAARTPAAEVSRQQLFGSPGFASAVLLKLPVGIVQKPGYLISFHKFGFGTIEPGASPTPFAPQTFPPNWVRSVVVTCNVPPAGSWGPGGPGTASGVPVFTPGTDVRRGPYPGYIVSTTPVRVTCPGSEAGKSRGAASHRACRDHWLSDDPVDDVAGHHRIIPAVDGPVDFPGVIVATGRVPPTTPPPGVSYAAQVQAQLTSPTGFGVPTVFDLYLDGNWIASRQMGYYASYPGGPPPVLADK